MPVQVKEWCQRDWTHPGYDLERSNAGSIPARGGALADLYCLAPDPHSGALKRAPAWALAPAYPSGVRDVQGAFFDADHQRTCFIGDRSGDMVLFYTATWSSWSSVTTLVSGKNLGGLVGRNVAYWGHYLWVIDEDKNVHRGADYTAALSSFYAGGDAEILCPMNDRMFGATSAGVIPRLTSAGTWSAYHSPVAALHPVYLTPFRQYMTVIAKGDDDTLSIYRLPDWSANSLHQLARLPTPGYLAEIGAPIALYDDKIWTLAGQQKTPSDYRIDVYTFDGTRTHLGAAISNLARFGLPPTSGLLVYHGLLIFYTLDTTLATGHAFRALVGDTFTDYAPLGYGAAGVMTPFAACIGDTLVTTARYDGAERLFYARRDQLADGYLVTARLDMGHPGLLKRLDTLTVILDGAGADFSVSLQYRVDDQADWTTTTTAAGTRIVRAADLATEFYLLQIRVEIDDDSATSQDIGIEAVSAVYTIST